MERRRADRRVVSDDEPLSRGKLRAGAELRIVDASSWGALAETRERLLPGRHLDLHIVATTGRVLVRARVTRAYVCRVHAEAVDYRAGFAFEQAVDVRAEGYPVPAAAAARVADAGTCYPDRPPLTDIEFAERPSA
jgi:hypothetical protein